LPTLAGSGSMAVVIGFSTLIQQGHSVVDQVVEYAISVLVILIVAAIVWLVLHSSTWFAQKLGEHGLTALSRVMGFLMVCIGIQFIPSGIAELIKSLH
jgi:multiple antibiotic resistance protein